MSGSIYLDACMIIDLVEGVPNLQRRLRGAIRGRTLVSTELARLESRVGALREQRTAHLATYRQQDLVGRVRRAWHEAKLKTDT